MRPRVAGRTLTLTVALVAALAVPVTTTATGAGAAPAGTTPTGETALRASHQVTLVTGDVVRLDVRADGTERVVPVAPSRASGGYHQYVSGGDSYYVPAAAERLVAQGTLDRELFNVSGLVRQGYDDAHRDALPLIVTYPKAASAPVLQKTAAPQGTRGRRVLTPVRGLAVAESKRDATAFWADVTGGANPASAARPALSDGIGRIWLDARVHADLDQSVPQIGGPAAWARGFDGTGVTVAVLDSGIDPDHPDFAGRIAATADFSGKGSVVDGAGHGTHVASILAGSGAASDGRYRGVAPGATLMVGKVLGDDGSGALSGVIAGMQWAASHGADVVNLSLGGPVTRGDDPMSQTLDELSEQYGTLFVVAAGNHSPFEPGSSFVTAPASADDALAVGSVNKFDRMASNSRQGRIGDTAVKPELVAPGVNITAARAAGTGFGDEPYTSMSGTSMAAPHAAGAAVLLKQQHPDWDYATLKAVLTSTATPLDGVTIVRAGAGRVDVDRATRQQVFVDRGTLDLGYLARPFDPDRMRVERTVHYRNGSDAPVTLALSTTLVDQFGQPAPDGALTVTPATLTLAPGEQAEASVHLDATALEPGTYTGRVVAASDRDLVVGTAVGFYKQDDTVDVTFRAIDRHGRPAQATLRLAPYKEEDFKGYFPDFFYLEPGATEQVVRLPEADYNLWADVLTVDESGRYVEERTIMSIPRVQAHAPNPTIVLDARTARPVTLSTPRPSTIRSFALSWFRGTAGTPFRSYDSMGVMVGDGSPERVSVAGTDPVDDAPFSVSTAFDAAPPVLVTHVGDTELDAVWEGGPPIDGQNIHMQVADAGGASPAELQGKYFFGKVALVRETPGIPYDAQVAAVSSRGARVVMLYSSQPGVFWPSAGGDRTVLALPKDQGDALHAQLQSGQPVVVEFDGQPRAPYAYDVSYTETGQVPDQLTYTVRPEDVAEVATRIHTTGTGEHGWRLYDFVYTPCDCDTSLVVDYVPSVGYTRTEYVTARPDTQVVPIWRYLYGTGGDYMYPHDAPAYRPGQKLTDDWLKAPFSPAPSSGSLAPFGDRRLTQRFGDSIFYNLVDWTDSAGHWSAVAAAPRQQKSRLYRDGTLLASSDFGLMGFAQAPAEDGEFRLEAEVDHDGTLWGLSTHTSSVWTFRSGHSDGATMLPLVDVDYPDLVDRDGNGLLDLTNTAPDRTAATLVLRAGHQDGATAAPVDSMRVWVSFDDGRTWTQATVTADGSGGFRASYKHPRVGTAGGYVSLRVSAADADGNTLDQTLVRAYRLARS